MPRKKESYEEIQSKLDEKIKSLESSDLNLDDLIKNYEDGVKLINKLYKMLNDYEGKIKVIENNCEIEFKE